MNQRTAHVVLFIFNLVAIAAVWYAIQDYVTVLGAIKTNQSSIPFDTGAYYLLLITVFWLFSVMQFISKKRRIKYAGLIVVLWFVGTLVIANILNYSIKSKFENNQYVKCADSVSLYRVAKGESSIYKKEGCE